MRLLLDAALRSSIPLLVGLAAAAALRRRSAALRHRVLALAIAAAAAVAPLSLALPSWTVDFLAAAPPAAESAAGRTATTTLVVSATTSSGSRLAISPLIVVWGAGTAGGFVLLLAGLGRLIWIGRRAERVRDAAWVAAAQRVARRLGLRRPVDLLQTDAPDLLATWGMFRPRVLLPAHARAWNEDRIHAVLSHELAHIRRHDWIVQIAAEAVRTVYWFNPLFWIACRTLRRDSEQACDDAVLSAGIAARDYARHLLDLARACRRRRIAWASPMPMARPSTLERRIAAMLNHGLDRRSPSRQAAAVALVLLLGVAAAAAVVRAAQTTPLPLTGSIYDTSGAVLPQVAVKLQDAQKAEWTATTDASGRFAFPAVAPGHYVLEASLPGFRSLKHLFELRNARDWDRAITMQVGELSETVTVSAARLPTVRPTPGAPAPQRLKVGGNIRAPRKLLDVRPVYPDSMREAGREGVVPVEALIGLDGSVVSVRVLTAQVHPDFAVAAADAVRQWRFDPTLLNGRPVEVAMTVSVEFKLAE